MSDFEVHRAHKMVDWVENEMYDWALNLVVEHFHVEHPNKLTEEQIQEVIGQADKLDYEHGDPISYGFYQIVRDWEEANDRALDY